jgi:DNA ligase-associated metallophosphoesterase
MNAPDHAAVIAASEFSLVTSLGEVTPVTTVMTVTALAEPRPSEATGQVTMAMIDIVGHTLMLLPEKVVFLPESDTLLVADLHIGKATTFRQLGVPVPAGTTDESLSTLTRLVRRLDVKRIVFLGDFLHSGRSMSETTFASVLRWRELHSALELTLVRGNHDDHAGDPPAILDIQAFDEPLRHGALAFCHHPQPVAGAYVLAGHLHPCVSVGGRAHDWHRLPCFWFSQQVGVLPAFGSFTGMQTIRTKQGERVFAAAAHRVFELQPKPKVKTLRSVRPA